MRPKRGDNHGFDCLVGCAVAAWMQGATLLGTGGTVSPKRERISFAALQGMMRRLSTALVARDRFWGTASTRPMEQASRLLDAARLSPVLVARADRFWSRRPLAQLSRRAAYSTRLA